jgi:hypothetical protein
MTTSTPLTTSTDHKITFEMFDSKASWGRIYFDTVWVGTWHRPLPGSTICEEFEAPEGSSFLALMHHKLYSRASSLDRYAFCGFSESSFLADGLEFFKRAASSRTFQLDGLSCSVSVEDMRYPLSLNFSI